MTPVLLLVTAILMGLFVTAGGAWGLLYCLGKTRRSKGMLWLALLAYAVALGLAVAIAFLTPLDFKWKALILVSGLVYAFIPPMTLRYLQALHSEEVPS
ncbi:MAG: hypothetical protein EPN34_01800 [Burkholderiaceae bacterium]|nr:MAG: hypothetical protein EPN34_01800 [Burkholderiaceae bacterium]